MMPASDRRERSCAMTPDLPGFMASGRDEHAWDQSVAGVLEALGTGFDVIPERGGASAAVRRTWLDTFDWRLSRAGLTLEYAGRPRGGELLLSGGVDSAAVNQPVIGWQAAR